MNFVTLKTLRLLTDSDLADVALRWAARDPEQFLVLCQDVLASKTEADLDAKEAGDNASPNKKSLAELLSEQLRVPATVQATPDMLPPLADYPNVVTPANRSWWIRTTYDNVKIDESLLSKLQSPSAALASKKVTCIKLIRNDTGCGLKEALDVYNWLVENKWMNIQDDLSPYHPSRY